MDVPKWFPFCCGAEDDYSSSEPIFNNLAANDEKSKLYPRSSAESPRRSDDDIAAEIVAILRSAAKPGVVLTQQLENACGGESWTQWIAKKVLAQLKTVLKEGREKMGPAMTEAYDEACNAADVLFRFAKDHPEATAGLLTIIAVGVLAALAPMIVEALGFAELGPVEGSFAAWWQSTYAGYVPAGSLFSFLQRLGMIWGRA